MDKELCEADTNGGGDFDVTKLLSEMKLGGAKSCWEVLHSYLLFWPTKWEAEALEEIGVIVVFGGIFKLLPSWGLEWHRMWIPLIGISLFIL